MAPTLTTMNSQITSTNSVRVSDLTHLYGVSFQKLDSLSKSRKDSFGLRKWVLVQNFMNERLIAPVAAAAQQEPLEWTEDDIRKDEENWLAACLEDLEKDDDDEDEDGFIRIRKPSDDDAYFGELANDKELSHFDEDMMDYEEEQQPSKTVDMEIDEDGEKYWRERKQKDVNMIIDRKDEYVNERIDPNTTSVDHNYHHWKDKSTIRIEEEKPPPPSEPFVNNTNTASSPSPPPSIAAYRPFFDTSSPEAVDHNATGSAASRVSPPSTLNNPRSHTTLGVPGFFRKYCLDRDYLRGIDPTEIDEPVTSSSTTTPPITLLPYSTSAALLDLVKSASRSQMTTGFINTTNMSNKQRSKDDMDLLYHSIATAPKVACAIDQGLLRDMAAMLEYFGDGGCEKKASLILSNGVSPSTEGGNVRESANQANIWFIDNCETLT